MATALCVLTGKITGILSVSASDQTDLLAACGLDGSFGSLTIGDRVSDSNNVTVVSEAHTGGKVLKLEGQNWKYFYCYVTNELSRLRDKPLRFSYWYKADGGMNIQAWDGQAAAHNAKTDFDGTTDEWKQASITFRRQHLLCGCRRAVAPPGRLRGSRRHNRICRRYDPL